MKNTQPTPKPFTAIVGSKAEKPNICDRVPLVHRKDGSFDVKASSRLLMKTMRKERPARLGRLFSWVIRTTFVRGHHRTCNVVSALFDYLSARIRVQGEEWYFDILHAKTPLELARVKKTDIGIYLERHGYNLETDTPGDVAKTFLDRRQPLQMSPEIRALIDHVREDKGRSPVSG